MKEKFCILMALAAGLLLFSGCHAGESEASSHEIYSSVSEADAPAASPADGAEVLTFEHIAYSDIRSEFAMASDGLYLLRCMQESSVNLFYVDIEAKQEYYVCNQPNCTHHDDSCTSYLSIPGSFADTTLAYYNDQLYIIKDSGNEEENGYIMRMDPDGGNRKKILELKSNQELGSYLFGYGNSLVLDVIETSSDSTASEWICLLDVDSGELTQWMNLETESSDSRISLTGCDSKYLLFMAISRNGQISIFRVDPTQSEKHLEDWMEEELLISFDQLSANAYVRDGYLCEVDRSAHTIAITDLETGVKKQQPYEDFPNETAGVRYLFDGKIQLCYLSDTGERSYLIDMDTGEKTPIDFINDYTNRQYILLGRTNGLLLFKTGYDETSTLNTDGGLIAGSTTYAEKMCVIAEENYLNNIHAEEEVVNAE